MYVCTKFSLDENVFCLHYVHSSETVLFYVVVGFVSKLEIYWKIFINLYLKVIRNKYGKYDAV